MRIIIEKDNNLLSHRAKILIAILMNSILESILTMPNSREYLECSYEMLFAIKNMRWMFDLMDFKLVFGDFVDRLLADDFLSQNHVMYWKMVAHTFCKPYIEHPKLKTAFISFLEGKARTKEFLMTIHATHFLTAMARWHIYDPFLVDYILSYIPPTSEIDFIRRAIRDLATIEYFPRTWIADALSHHSQLLGMHNPSPEFTQSEWNAGQQIKSLLANSFGLSPRGYTFLLSPKVVLVKEESSDISYLDPEPRNQDSGLFRMNDEN